jgi:hypothetical protein
MKRRASLLLPLATALVFSCAYFHVGRSLLHVGAFRHYNNLFNADVPRIIDDMTLVEGNHYRVKVHPLFVLLALPPGLLLRSMLGSAELASVLLVSACGGLCIAVTGRLFERLGLRRGESMWLAVSYGLSASSLVLFSIPESYVFSALSFALALLGALGAPRLARQVGVGMFSFGILVTNLVHVALAPLLARKSMRRGALARAGVVAGFVVVFAALLARLQEVIFPTASAFFRRGATAEESHYMVALGSLGDLLARWKILFAHLGWYNVVAPHPNVIRPPGEPIDWITFLPSPGHALAAGFGPAGAVASALWLPLLAWSTGVHLRWGRRRTETWVVVGWLGFNVVLFTIYGDDLFLYSPLWTLHLFVWVAVALRYCRERACPAPAWALPPLALALLFSNTRFIAQVLSVYRGIQPP